MTVLRGGNVESIDQIFAPDADDYTALRKTLVYLKFTPDETEQLFKAIGGVVNLVAGVVSVVGAVSSAVDLLNKLGFLGEDESEAALERIGARVETIYGYLLNQDQKDLYKQAQAWRVAGVMAQTWRSNVQISRSEAHLDEMGARARALDTALLTMLDIGSGNIAFNPGVYGYQWRAGHWIDRALSPHMNYADGRPMRFRNTNIENTIWDPGYYLDVLIGALQERVAVATAIEPVFRSTGHERDLLSRLATELEAFVRHWESSVLVNNPESAIGADGRMHDPANAQPPVDYIRVGAVDPVTGVSGERFLRDFPIRYERLNYGQAHGGGWDEAFAVDPAAALTAAQQAHLFAVRDVLRGAGIGSLRSLARQFRKLSTPPGDGQSEVVDLPDATFSRHRSTFAESTETIDLGDLKHYAADPTKTYQVRRVYQSVEKTFRFRIARRTDVSKVQLGYRLQVGERSFSLCPYSANTAATPAAVPITAVQAAIDVYDCLQSRVLSPADEDQFERDGSIAGGQRVFANVRRGQCSIDVAADIDFADGGSQDYAHAVTVSIRTSAEERFPDASILDVVVHETRVDADSSPEKPRAREYIADSMTVHLVPSYLIAPADYFADREAAWLNMLRQKAVVHQYSLHDLWNELPTEPNPDPKFGAGIRAIQIERGAEFLKIAREAGPASLRGEMERFDVPRLEGPG